MQLVHSGLTCEGKWVILALQGELFWNNTWCECSVTLQMAWSEYSIGPGHFLLLCEFRESLLWGEQALSTATAQIHRNGHSSQLYPTWGVLIHQDHKHREFHLSLQNSSWVFYLFSKEMHLIFQASCSITRWMFWAGAWAAAETSRRKAYWQDFPQSNKWASSRALPARVITKKAVNSCSIVFPARLTGMALLSYSAEARIQPGCLWQRCAVHVLQPKRTFCGSKPSQPVGLAASYYLPRWGEWPLLAAHQFSSEPLLGSELRKFLLADLLTVGTCGFGRVVPVCSVELVVFGCSLLSGGVTSCACFG